MASARSFPELSFAGFAGEKTDYVSGPTGTLARITNDVVTYLHPDHLGSAQAGTRANGTVAWREQYTPFGEELQSPAANDNLGGFTGHIKDSATGLNPCIFPSENCTVQARYYDPVIGRFLSVDPVTFLDNGDPGYFNRYAYTMNDPVNRIDPDGRKSYLVSRELKSFKAADHMMVIVVDDKTGAVSRFSYGPNGDSAISNPGKLVSHTGTGSVTDKGDAAAAESFLADPAAAAEQGITGIAINATDDAVRAQGNAVDAALGTKGAPADTAPGYSVAPGRGRSTQANSNSAAYAVANRANPSETQAKPPGSYNPGLDNHYNIPQTPTCSGDVDC